VVWDWDWDKTDGLNWAFEERESVCVCVREREINLLYGCLLRVDEEHDIYQNIYAMFVS
jgi:hypothetical protein